MSKRLPHSTYRSKGPALTKHHRINTRELTLTQHWHWMVTSIQNTKNSRLRLLSKLHPDLNVKASKMIYTNTVIPVFTYCGTVNLDLLRTLLGKLDWIHECAVGIITKTITVKLTPIMTYVKRHACQIVRTSITRQLPAPMTNYFELLSHWKTLVALPRVRTKAAQNGFYYQGAMIYNSLTRDICMQENENLYVISTFRIFNSLMFH